MCLSALLLPHSSWFSCIVLSAQSTEKRHNDLAHPGTQSHHTRDPSTGSGLWARTVGTHFWLLWLSLPAFSKPPAYTVINPACSGSSCLDRNQRASGPASVRTLLLPLGLCEPNTPTHRPSGGHASGFQSLWKAGQPKGGGGQAGVIAGQGCSEWHSWDSGFPNVLGALEIFMGSLSLPLTP